MSQGSAAPGPLSRRHASQVVFVGQGALAHVVYERLAKALGERRASEVYLETSAQLGDRRIETAGDMAQFAEILIRAGGLLKAVGHSLKIQALLHGAIDHRRQSRP
jgi:hypothetical protein